ncbi:hypothetical protein FHR94_003813 [Halomonas cerina]|uniref:Uncharacterized protein n=1 Tax=Halomonas cerina TaxID=447424 RepID=A0A839VIM4_9GAMM|nr:hypothetical protein [Halomonas cerina]
MRELWYVLDSSGNSRLSRERDIGVRPRKSCKLHLIDTGLAAALTRLAPDQ